MQDARLLLSWSLDAHPDDHRRKQQKRTGDRPLFVGLAVQAALASVREPAFDAGSAFESVLCDQSVRGQERFRAVLAHPTSVLGIASGKTE